VSELESKIPKHLADSLVAALNKHGYAFQYSLLRELDHLGDDIPRKVPWPFEVAEFPVSVQGDGTRIDFVLTHAARRHYVLAECKRADPRISNWCFVRAPYVRKHRGSESVIVERLRFMRGNWSTPNGILKNKFYDATGVAAGHTDNAYHLAFELHSQDLGEKSEAASRGGDGRTIETASTQILRGMNGLAEWMSRTYDFFKDRDDVILVPVIFTTARIFKSDVDLGSASLTTGKLAASDLQLEETKWVAYQYHMSPGIKHQLPSVGSSTTLGEALDRDYIRTIYIVNGGAFESFLRRLPTFLDIF